MGLKIHIHTGHNRLKRKSRFFSPDPAISRFDDILRPYKIEPWVQKPEALTLNPKP